MWSSGGGSVVARVSPFPDGVAACSETLFPNQRDTPTGCCEAADRLLACGTDKLLPCRRICIYISASHISTSLRRTSKVPRSAPESVARSQLTMPSPQKPTIDPSSTPAQNTQIPAAAAYSSPIGSAGTKVSCCLPKPLGFRVKRALTRLRQHAGAVVFTHHVFR